MGLHLVLNYFKGSKPMTLEYIHISRVAVNYGLSTNSAI